MTKDEFSVRQEVRTWLAEQIRAKRSFKLPKLVDRAVKVFAADHGFLRRFASEMLRQAIYELAVNELSEARGPISLNAVPVKLGSSVSASVWERWEQHFEHAGETYIRLPDLTATLGKLAIAERRGGPGMEGPDGQVLVPLIPPLGRAHKGGGRWGCGIAGVCGGGPPQRRAVAGPHLPRLRG